MIKLSQVIRICFIGLAMLASHGAVANQTETLNGADGGSLRPVTQWPSTVRMVREDIKIDFTRSDFYQVTIDTLFHNDGGSQEVFIGIPELGYSDRPGLGHVSLWVDSVRQSIHWTAIKHSMGFFDPSSVWVHNVSFVRGQNRRMRVQYRSVLSGSCASGLYYKFADGKWHGRISERSLTLVDLSRHRVTHYFPSIDEDDGPPGTSSLDEDVALGGKLHRYFHSWRLARNFGILCIDAI